MAVQQTLQPPQERSGRTFRFMVATADLRFRLDAVWIGEKKMRVKRDVRDLPFMGSWEGVIGVANNAPFGVYGCGVYPVWLYAGPTATT